MELLLRADTIVAIVEGHVLYLNLEYCWPTSLCLQILLASLVYPLREDSIADYEKILYWVRMKWYKERNGK